MEITASSTQTATLSIASSTSRLALVVVPDSRRRLQGSGVDTNGTSHSTTDSSTAGQLALVSGSTRRLQSSGGGLGGASPQPFVTYTFVKIAAVCPTCDPAMCNSGCAQTAQALGDLHECKSAPAGGEWAYAFNLKVAYPTG